MRKFMIGIVGFLIYCIPARWHYVCQVRNLCEEEQSIQNINKIKYERISDIPRSNDLMLKKDSTVILENFEQFAFLPNKAKLELTANNLIFLDSLTSIIKANQRSVLSITGHYYFGESPDSTLIYDNIGIARAAVVREYLIAQKGISKDIITLDYEMQKSQTIVKQPLTFNILTNNKAIQANYTFKRMTFSSKNFWDNTDKFDPTDNFITYADSLKKYLDVNPDNTVTIIGHTNNEHDEDYNYGLGLSLANNIVIYLRDKLGIPLDKIDAQSKGAKEPIAPSEHDFLQDKNQRVEIIIN